MPETDCDALHRHAADLHAQAERGMREAASARSDRTAFVDKVGHAARCEAEAKVVETRIEEDC